jgi:hypothetical protein
MTKKDILEIVEKAFKSGEEWWLSEVENRGFQEEREEIVKLTRDILNHHYYVDLSQYVFDKDDIEIAVDSNKLSGKDDYVKVTHIPTGLFSWKECRYSYDGELQSVVEMLLEIVNMRVMEMWEKEGINNDKIFDGRATI